MSKKPSTSSTCSAVSEDSALDLNEPGLFGQLPSASESRSAKPSSESIGPASRSTTTLEPSTQIDLEELTSSAAGSHASLGVSPGSSEAQKMTVTSGRSWLPLLKTYGLDGSLAKMCEVLLTSRWASSAAFLTWKASDTKPSHLLFQLAPSMPRTDEIGSGLWRTPMAADGTHNHCLAPSVLNGKTTLTLTNQVQGVQRGLWRTPDANCGKRGPKSKEMYEESLRTGVHAITINDQVKMWPTPRSCSAMAAENIQNRRDDKFPNLESVVARTMWPTPTTRDHKGGRKPETLAESGRGETNSLNDAVTVRDQHGSLNPAWVEWLMGFPEGWTDLKPSEMPSSRKSSSESEKQSSQEKTDEMS